jgi:hypothetical protein
MADSAIINVASSATTHMASSATTHLADSAIINVASSATTHLADSATIHVAEFATTHLADSATIHVAEFATTHLTESDIDVLELCEQVIDCKYIDQPLYSVIGIEKPLVVFGEIIPQFVVNSLKYDLLPGDFNHFLKKNTCDCQRDHCHC